MNWAELCRIEVGNSNWGNLQVGKGAVVSLKVR